MASSDCDFLAHIDANFFSMRYGVLSEKIERHPAVDLLVEKKSQELLTLVTSGNVSVTEALKPWNLSLLEMAIHTIGHRRMTEHWKMVPKLVKDVELLLDNLKSAATLKEENIYLACSCNCPELLEVMLRHGAPVGPDALHWLLKNMRNLEPQLIVIQIKLLVEAKAEIDALGSFGVTPLTTACEAFHVHEAVVACLLDLKADIAGAKGSRSPLHARASRSLGTSAQKGVTWLVEHRADPNQIDVQGKTAIHHALCGHPNVAMAMRLKSLGTDATLADHKGVRPAQILLKHNKPQAAAELEGRAMNEEEQRLQKAMEHPLAYRLSRSVFGSISWVISRCPDDGYRGYCNNEECDEFPYGDKRISEFLGGKNPKAWVLQLPLTRYSELFGELHLTSPQPDGFTVTGVLMEIYKFYQDSFSKEELAEIRALRGSLTDTFGYVARNVSHNEEEQEEKMPKIPRIELRGDSVFFEGLNDCKYFEDEDTLWGRMSLGS